VQVGPHGALDVPRAARELLDQRAGLDVDVDLDPGEIDEQRPDERNSPADGTTLDDP
jgi:hypothetical protein